MTAEGNFFFSRFGPKIAGISNLANFCAVKIVILLGLLANSCSIMTYAPFAEIESENPAIAGFLQFSPILSIGDCR